MLRSHCIHRNHQSSVRHDFLRSLDRYPDQRTEMRIKYRALGLNGGVYPVIITARLASRLRVLEIEGLHRWTTFIHRNPQTRNYPREIVSST